MAVVIEVAPTLGTLEECSHQNMLLSYFKCDGFWCFITVIRCGRTYVG